MISFRAIRSRWNKSICSADYEIWPFLSMQAKKIGVKHFTFLFTRSHSSKKEANY